jgi:hypothetical protein
MMKLGEKAVASKSFPDATKLFEDAIKKGSELIENNKVSGRYFQLRDIMKTCAYNVVVVRRESGNVEEQREIFEFVKWCVSLKFGPTLIVREGLNALDMWLKEFRDDRRMPNATRKRLRDGLYDIRRYLNSQQTPRVAILSQCDRLIAVLESVP